MIAFNPWFVCFAICFISLMVSNACLIVLSFIFIVLSSISRPLLLSFDLIPYCSIS